MLDFLQGREVLIALLSGGALAKLIDYAAPAILKRRAREAEYETTEKDNLRKDIEFLRGQIEELRKDVEDLRQAIVERDRDISIWQRRYWDKKVKLDRVLAMIRHYDDRGLKEKVRDLLDGEEVVSIEDDV